MTTKTVLTLAAEIVRTSALPQEEIDAIVKILSSDAGKKKSKAIVRRLAQYPGLLSDVKSAGTPLEVEMQRTRVAFHISDVVLS